MSKKYTVVFEPDEGNWWAITIPSVPGVLTQAKSLEQGRKRIREALSLAIGDDAAEAAELVDDIRLPPKADKTVRDVAIRVAEVRKLQDNLTDDLRRAAKLLRTAGLSLRDSADVLGVSHSRVQQVLEEKRAS